MTHTVTPPDDTIEGSTVEYTVPRHVTKEDLAHDLPDIYHKNKGPAPMNGADAIIEDIEVTGPDTKAVDVRFENTQFTYGDPNEEHFELLKEWVDGLFEWINEEY